MTTKITVDAHSGLDILVVQLAGEPNYHKFVKTDVVPAFEKRDFYVHSGLKIINIEELPSGR